jgi:hypothetical protein
MKQIVLLLIGGLSFWNLPAQKTVVNDPNAQQRSVKGFHVIEVSSAIDLYLTQDKEETVVVSAREIKWRDHIRTEVVSGVLKIYLDKSAWSWAGGNKKMKAYVSFVAIDKLSASGASDVFVDGAITADNLAIHLSGASDFKGAVKVSALDIDQSGASDVVITGTVSGTTIIHSSGASDMKGYGLATDNCEAHASGASDIQITVNKELKAHASGASSINYRGEGVIRDLRSSGASNINNKS